MDHVLGFDIGASKVAWGCFAPTGKVITTGRFATPETLDQLIATLADICKEQKALAVGIGVAGTINADHTGTVHCPNLPQLSGINFKELLNVRYEVPVMVDNDARCALIGEVWKGSATNLTDCVLITLGTGIGGAVMQKGAVRQHPTDLSQEVGRIVVDPSDVFPARSGSGTVEAFLGGRNIEERLQIDLNEQAELVRQNDAEAKEIWHAISYFFIQCVRAIQAEYACGTLIVGGIGSKDLEYYLQDLPPCRIIPAALGAEAGFYGAGRLALDLYEGSHKAEAEAK